MVCGRVFSPAALASVMNPGREAAALNLEAFWWSEHVLNEPPSRSSIGTCRGVCLLCRLCCSPVPLHHSSNAHCDRRYLRTERSFGVKIHHARAANTPGGRI